MKPRRRRRAVRPLVAGRAGSRRSSGRAARCAARPRRRTTGARDLAATDGPDAVGTDRDRGAQVDGCVRTRPATRTPRTRPLRSRSSSVTVVSCRTAAPAVAAASTRIRSSRSTARSVEGVDTGTRADGDLHRLAVARSGTASAGSAACRRRPRRPAAPTWTAAARRPASGRGWRRVSLPYARPVDERHPERRPGRGASRSRLRPPGRRRRPRRSRCSCCRLLAGRSGADDAVEPVSRCPTTAHGVVAGAVDEAGVTTMLETLARRRTRRVRR